MIGINNGAFFPIQMRSSNGNIIIKQISSDKEYPDEILISAKSVKGFMKEIYKLYKKEKKH